MKRKIFVALILALAPIGAMAATSDEAEACWKCDVTNTQCLSDGATGYANCYTSPPPFSGCFLSGLCIG
jgi:protein-arginine kinase activator protein McsA